MTQVTLIRVVGALTGGWAVGAATAESTINIPVLRDPRTGRPVLPATTLVGSLREHLGPELGERWLGPEPTEASTDNARSPSVLWTSWVGIDAEEGDRRVSGTTAIDPARGAALGRSLRLEERTERPNGRSTRFSWVLEHQGTADRELLTRISSWSATIGRRQNAGQGGLTVESLAAFTFDLDRADHLTWWLAERAAQFFAIPVDGEVSVPATVPVIPVAGDSRKPLWIREYRWKVTDPLHIGDPLEEDFVDGSSDRRAAAQRVQRQRGTGDQPRLPVVPGTTWKGIFRHRTDYILNTLGARSETSIILGTLFGQAPTSAADGTERIAGRRGMLHFADSIVESGKGSDPRHRDRNHVAIDRISGGARDGLLFAKEGIDAGRLTLTVSARHALPTEVENLLRHVVLDIDEGLIGIGGSTTRGYGTVALATKPPGATPIDVTSIAAWCNRIVEPQQERS